MLFEAFDLVQADITALHEATQLHTIGCSTSVRKRLKWALLEKRSTAKMLLHLKNSESTLAGMIQILTLYGPKSGYWDTSLMLASRYSLLGCYPKAKTVHGVTSSLPSAHLALVGVSAEHRRTAILKVDSWLRWCGFYGSFVYISCQSRMWESRVCIGYKPPSWMLTRSISMELHLSGLPAGEQGFRVLSGHVALQNRVDISSPFLKACQQGDVPLIRQLLENGKGNIRDRSTCLGKTPLLVS